MYVLILITTLFSGAVHTTHIEFESMGLCETALAEVKELGSDKLLQNLYVSGVCVKRKTGWGNK